MMEVDGYCPTCFEPNTIAVVDWNAETKPCEGCGRPLTAEYDESWDGEEEVGWWTIVTDD